MRTFLASVALMALVGAALLAPAPLLRLGLSSIVMIEGFKLAAWILRAPGRPQGRLGSILFWFLWPGVLPTEFYQARSENSADTREFIGAWVRFVVGGAFLVGLLLIASFLRVDLAVFSWAVILGILLTLHLGIVTALPHIYRSLGVAAPLTFDRPWQAQGLLDFWGRRWNRPFVEVSRFFVLRHIRRAPAVARYLAGFLASGLLHEIALSGVARGGWGKPTLYFAIQAFGVFLERRLRLDRARPTARVGFTLLFVVAPLNLLFHSEFRSAVFAPLLQWTQGLDLSGAALAKLALLLAGAGTLFTLAVGSQVPSKLGWREELKRLRPFNEKLLRNYYAYTGGSVVFLGTVTLGGREEILRGGFLASAFLAYAFVFWLARVLVDVFYFKHEDWPAGKMFVIGHVCLTTFFALLVGAFGFPLVVVLAST